MKRLRLHHIISWLLLAIMGLIVFHAPLTVLVESRWPMIGDTVKAWKELLLLVALVLTVVEYHRHRAWSTLRRDMIVWLAGVYALLHIAVLGLFPVAYQQAVAGLMIDLRYVAYFAAVYTFLKLYPNYRRSFFKIASMGAAVVVGFAVMQSVLPHDFLKYIGYGDSTIRPYLTVDNNPEYIRLQSTLRGPNPLGAYALVVFAGMLAFLRDRENFKNILKHKAPLCFGVAAVLALWFSYSRSAMLGALVVVAILAWSLRQHFSWQQQVAAVGSIAVAGILAAILLQGTSFWHNVVIHDNPSTGAAIDSNQGHAESLQDGLARMAVQPLGGGIGSTGSASLYGEAPLIIESQYLFVAHEVGWMGLVLFVALFARILLQSWRGRQDWRQYALFLSGIGLAVIGFMQPVWADDTVAMVWWGLAGALYGMKGVKRGTATNKKTT